MRLLNKHVVAETCLNMETKFEVPIDLDVSNWKNVEPYARELTERSINSVEELEAWLFDRAHVVNLLDEFHANTFTSSNRDTADVSAKEALESYTTNIEPKLRELKQIFNKKLLDCPYSDELRQERYEVLLRNVKCDTKIYSEDNLDLFPKDEELRQEYFKIRGSMTVDYEGEELPLPVLQKKLEETDRSLRERVWHMARKREHEDAEKLEKLYSEMVPLRHKVALNAGCANYVEYAFKDKKRFDYTPEDCLQFHESVEKHLTPLVRSFSNEKADKLGLDSLRPWDMLVNKDSREPLKPFRTTEELIEKSSKVFNSLDPQLGAFFDSMREGDCLDLDSRKNKALIGYLWMRKVSGKPFIFMNAAGADGDLRTLNHESGHAFHSLLCNDDPIYEYTDYPAEFGEVASMAMELLVGPHLHPFYSAEEMYRTRLTHLKGSLKMIIMICKVDALQHWAYTRPDATTEDRHEAWMHLQERFDFGYDISGLDSFMRKSWLYTNHPFTYPMYMIEYAIAQLGAYQIWLLSLDDPDRALSGYKEALKLGGSRPLPELFEAAGIKFDFSPDFVKSLADRIKIEMDKMES